MYAKPSDKPVKRPSLSKLDLISEIIVSKAKTSEPPVEQATKQQPTDPLQETIGNIERPSRTSRELISKLHPHASKPNLTPHCRENRVPCPHFKNHCWFPSNLIAIINHILSVQPKTMSNPEFMFEMSSSAAQHNWIVLKKYNTNLETALLSQQNTQLGYGSEFRDPDILELIFTHHPLWKRLKSQLKSGSHFPLQELSTDERKLDLMEALEFGNHKGVSENPDLFEKMMKNDIDYGYSLVLPRDKIEFIHDALISPMNIADQNGINERGEIVKKKRLTHNQSCKFQSGTSVNSRTIKDDLQDVMYGPCLLRIVHLIVEYRRQYPEKKILLSKIDFKSAYRRSHLQAKTAIQTITSIEVVLKIPKPTLRAQFAIVFWGSY